jgi:hypothetical protein
MKYFYIVFMVCVLTVLITPSQCNAGWKNTYEQKPASTSQVQKLADNSRFYFLFFPMYNYIVRTSTV